MTPDELPEGWRLVDFGSLLTDSQNDAGKGQGSNGPPSSCGSRTCRSTDRSPRRSCVQSGLAIPSEPSTRCGRAIYSPSGSTGVRPSLGGLFPTPVPEGHAYCDHFIRFRLHEGKINSRFAALAFPEPGVRAQVEARMVSSAGQNTVSQASFREIILPVPPLEQQKHIVEKVDALLAEVNGARERLTRVREMQKRFRQSVLAAACSGRLTEGGEWPAQKPRFRAHTKKSPE